MIETKVQKNLWCAYIEDIAAEISHESNIAQEQPANFLKKKIKTLEADITLEKNSACDFLKYFGCSRQTENKLREIVKNELIWQIKKLIKTN